VEGDNNDNLYTILRVRQIDEVHEKYMLLVVEINSIPISNQEYNRRKADAL
jgi:hypothetical protein